MTDIGMFIQEGLVGSAWGACALNPASPRRAFDNELGVQAAVGFSDPAGFTAVGSQMSFLSQPPSVLVRKASNGNKH